MLYYLIFIVFFLSRYGKVRLLDSMLEYNLLEEVKTESRGSKSAKKQKYPKKAEYL